MEHCMPFILVLHEVLVSYTSLD